MPWVFNDSKGNIKESTVTTLARAMGQLISSGTANHTTSGSWQQLTGANTGWTVGFDTSSITDPTNGKLTAPVAGRYRVTATLHWSNTSTTGIRGLQVNKNSVTANTGTIAEADTTAISGITNDLTVTEVLTLAAGDYLSMLAYQNSGGTLQYNVTGVQATFTLERVDEATQTIVPSGAQVLICSQVLSGTQANFDTNTILGGNIPTTYNHLQAFVLARGDTAAATVAIYGRFNNDSGTNYLLENLVGHTTTAGAGNNAAANVMQLHDQIPAATDTAGRPGCVEWFIPCYAQTTFHKATISKAYGIGAQAVELTGNAWANTSAVTRIQILLSAGNFAAGSAFYLYGIL